MKEAKRTGGNCRGRGPRCPHGTKNLFFERSKIREKSERGEVGFKNGGTSKEVGPMHQIRDLVRQSR